MWSSDFLFGSWPYLVQFGRVTGPNRIINATPQQTVTKSCSIKKQHRRRLAVVSIGLTQFDSVLVVRMCVNGEEKSIIIPIESSQVRRIPFSELFISTAPLSSSLPLYLSFFSTSLYLFRAFSFLKPADWQFRLN